MMSKGMTNIGILVALMNLNNNVGILSNLGDELSKLQSCMAGVRGVSNLLDEEVEFHKYEKSINKGDRDSIIELKDIIFGYDDKKVLDSVSISAKKGESIALVGKSGCGKSTIAKLLLGFYESNNGDIFIEGKSVSNYSLEELRNKISYVSQSPYLFDGTIKDNIRYGRLDSTEEEIINSAKMANAHEFIMEQKEGYDTSIGEVGSNLSGGQKQRIAIARAINKGSSILLLDEATSALDSEAEEKVQQAIEKIMNEKTVLIIAHRLSTIKKVDKIYVIDKGKVLESGNHEELMLHQGIYSELYDIQYS
ncbi:ABC transporter ATP-binding protein [Dethiothermospora halolimnae]|uniref:ABC transporter ATP-binding protein n=1 Tax=Dethiothermospora halolimnae TaxID=3114390 RepID=UPI003CCBEA9D